MTWADEELVTANLLNEQVRDKLNMLKNPPTDHYECDESSNYTTSSTSFTDVDATNLALTITTTGGDVIVHFHGYIEGGGNRVALNVAMDGLPVAADDGIISGYVNSKPFAFSRLITDVSSGLHTFKLQWKVYSGNAAMAAGAGTDLLRDVHPQFWAREVS